ncbi:MAG: DNA repair protein RecO [Candidatus Paceibacterota bacterium]|jgi:DNA repair protein RecO (recombination protein O)
MHHIYHTNGFILSSVNKGEANKMLTIYTREMGLARAMVQGIRLHKSKLRFALQDLSYSNIDLVRGRDIWRVTSAKNITTFPYARSSRTSLLIIARVSKLLERLCDGEQSNEKIFDDFIQSLYLLDVESVASSSQEALELHLVLRIMDQLGYIGESDMLKEYLGGNIDLDKTELLLKEKRSIISHINKALNESQL